MPVKCRTCGKYHMGLCGAATMYVRRDEGKYEINSIWDALKWVLAIWIRCRKVRKGSVIH